MERQESRVPTGIRDFSVALVYIAEPREEEQQKQVQYEIQVVDQDGSVEWIRRGDLIPYLDDSSEYLETADRAVLLDFMTRVRQEAAARILPE